MEPRSWTNYPKTTPEVVKWSGGRRGRGSKKGPAILADPPYDYLSLLRKRRSTTIPPTARRLVVIQITMLLVSPVLGLFLVFALAFSVFLLSFFSFFAVSAFLFSDFFSFFTSDFLLSVFVSFLTAGVSVLQAQDQSCRLSLYLQWSLFWLSCLYRRSSLFWQICPDPRSRQH